MLKILLFVLFALSSFAQASWADIITLKSGKKIEGKVLEKTQEYIKVDFDGVPLYYERKVIAGIDENEGAVLSEADILREGLKLATDSKIPEAEEAFRKGLAVYPSSHNLKEALKLIQGLKDGTIKQDYAMRILRGSYYLMNSQIEEATSEFKSALENHPNADLNYYLGVCLYASGKYEEAIDYLKKAALEIKDDDELYYDLGISHYALRRYPEAVDYLQKALQINPESAEALGVLGTCHFLLGQPLQAVEELKKSRDYFRKNGDYLKAADVETFLNQINR